MQYTRGEKQKNKISITFDINKKEWNDWVEKAYQKDKAKYKKEGFRQGKVPRKVLENTFGESVFYETAFDLCFPAVFSEMLTKEPDIYAVDYPEIDVLNVGSDGLKFIANVEVLPEVKLGKYTGLEVKTEKPKVIAEEVNAEINRLRERNARFVDILDRPAKMNDIVEINYSGSVDGKIFEGGSAKNYELELGSHSFIPGFEEGVVGMNIGTIKNVEVKFPENYHAENLAGKPAVFEVELISIREKVLPELNDDFAKDVSEVDSLDALKKQIKERLLNQKKESNDLKLENDIVKLVVDNSKVDVPNSMVERQLDYFVNDFSYRLSYQGLKFEDYLKYIGKTLNEYRDMRRKEAEIAVKSNLVLDELIKTEKIDASDDEIVEFVNKQESDDKLSAKTTKKTISDEQKKAVKNRIISEKLISFLKKNNKIIINETK